MPIRRYRKKRAFKKKRYTRNARRRKTVMYKGVGPPPSVMAKLCMSSLRQATITAGSTDSRVWGINTLFDPDISGTGLQPMYFDQYAAMYNNYIVYGAKFDVKITCGSGTSNMYYPIALICPYVFGLGNWTTIQDMIAEPGAQWKWMIPGNKQASFRGFYKPHRIAGISKLKYSNEENYSAAKTANPTNVIALNVNVANLDGSQSISVATEIRITYYAKFFNVIRLALS